ncbi:transcriptional regulator with XRE-family HTH domain [Nocardioides luteus]|uniref:helix-turn-helix transcriptional regulator n=2 Tax=Nocardioides luteus TaxID=1844 RepID=UPI0028675005|nr:helix-turn-helix transcriptional regulator [Nocardioides luteus]MDR7311312.1 transcriptional regulator with XRE-family HTH domain [Nocardioides luteus]
MTAHQDRDRRLGEFLRDRRGRVTPAEVGLPSIGRRRTPGPRREEVAQLAGVGVTWYTWLEQGRARNVSDQVLDAVARVLRLDPVEHRYMRALAGRPATPTPPAPFEVRPEHGALLERLLPYPAVLQTNAFDLPAANRTYRYVFDDLDAIPAADRNCMWLFFTHPGWRNSVEDESVLGDLVARVRAREPEMHDDERWREMLGRLRERSPEFVRLWEECRVAGERTQHRRYLSATAGPLDIVFQGMWLDDARRTRLVVLLPGTAETKAKLERLDALHGSAPAWTAPGQETPDARAAQA